MRSTPKFLILAAMAVSSSCLTGCFLGSENNGPSAEAVKQSDAAALKADADLETSVTRMSDMSQFRYGKEDLTTLRNSRSEYSEALRLNPGNNRAHLGMALTGVLIAGQTKGLADIINRTLDNKSPFDMSLTENAPLMRAGVLRKVAEASAWPEFHEIQDSIANILLPALEDAIAHLNVVYQDPSFSAVLTIEGEARELDHAEAGVLLAGVKAIHGLLTLYLSYDIDVDYKGSYDYIAALEGLDTVENFDQLTAEQRDALNKAASILSPASPFLAVRPAWQARLANVDDEIKSALTVLKEAVGSIASETDAQDNDLIHVCAGFEDGSCISANEYDAGKGFIDSARKYMDQPYVFHLTDIDTTVKVDFAAYFRVQDYKKMLPYYGFYDAAVWSESKPILYFKDAQGNITGDIKTLIQIGKDADAQGTPASQVIAQIRQVIHLQDPTFQGFLPGAKENDIWNLLTKQAEWSESHSHVIYKKSALAPLKPNFALSLIGK